MKFSDQSYWISALFKKPILAKWYLHWRSSLNGKRSPLEDELPWATYGSIDWLAKYLSPEMFVFEWGSGGSTIYFSKRVKQVVTIEHDPRWYQQVAHSMEKRGCKNILFRLVEPVQSNHIDQWYTSTDIMYKGYSFERYIKAIDIYPDGFFDLVVVDGRARPGCMKHALAKIRNRGYLLLDNSERNEYQTGWNLLEGLKSTKIWGPGPYINYPWETRIWQVGG